LLEHIKVQQAKLVQFRINYTAPADVITDTGMIFRYQNNATKWSQLYHTYTVCWKNTWFHCNVHLPNPNVTNTVNDKYIKKELSNAVPHILKQ